MFKKFLAFAVALALVLPMDVMAKGGSSGGGRSSGGFSSGRSSGSSFSGSRSSGFSSGSSRSSSSGFSSKPSSGFSGSSSKPAAIPSTPRSSGSGFSSSPSKPSTPAATPSSPSSSPRSSGSWFSSSPSTKSTPTTTSKPPQTSLDAKVSKANTTSAPSYKSKEQAVAAFKEKNASQYTSKFITEPKTRPDYIPQSTSVGGKTVNVTYNAGFGGYGYYHPTLGTWMAYDMMHDAAMMSIMMNRHGGYTYVDGPGYTGGPVVVTHQSSAFGVFITFFLVLALIFAVVIVARIILE